MYPLKIAYISFEYPPDTSGGGIGSYTHQIARLMKENGHNVTVFCGTSLVDYQINEDGISVYKIQSKNPESFRKKVVTIFADVFRNNKFDIIESPEYGADGYEIKRAFPQLPYIVKLHSPTYIINEYNNYFRNYQLPKRYILRIKIWIRKRLLKKPVFDYNKEQDIEYKNVILADKVLSPSIGLARKISKDWSIPIKKMAIIPNPYIPNKELLNSNLTFNCNTVTFIGKLSILKGLIDFTEAIPLVLNKLPKIHFRFIGLDSFSPDEHKTMKEYLLDKNSSYKNNIEFLGKIDLAMIPGYLTKTDILVCNSLWENYPTVLLEAMSAGKIVIGTKVGGIPEIIEHKKNGFLIKAKSAKDLAKTIIKIYKNKSQMIEIGEEGRKKIISLSASGGLYERILHSYHEVLEEYKMH